MATVQPPRRARAADRARRFTGRWRRIGPRLLAGFLLLIVPTMVIGVVAIERFSALTATTTELSQQDLPEIVTVDHLRTLLYQQLDLAQAGLGDASARAHGADLVAEQRKALLALEPSDTSHAQGNDTALVQTLIDGTARSDALSRRIQALISSGRSAQARALQAQQVPLITSLITATTRLRTLEDREAIAAAAQVQQESSTATRLVLALTILAVPLSVLLALLLARSLTRPLAALLGATRALAAGDLEASPRVESRDEIGQLAGAFDAMRLSLRTTISALALERQQTQAIIDASVDGVMLADARLNVVQMNPAAVYLTGWAADEAIGQPCWKVCGCQADPSSAQPCPFWTGPSMPDDENCPEPAPCSEPEAPTRGEQLPTCAVCPRTMLVQATEKSVTQELLIHLRGGQERWLAVSCAPIPGGDEKTGRRLVISLHDISQLKALDQLKSDFVAMVSHELRAPVTTVGGAVEMLGQLDPSVDGSSYHEVLSILEQQTRRLRTVVNEVLQVTRLEAGRLPVRLQPLPLMAFLRAFLEQMRQEWSGDEHPLRLREGAEMVVWADPDMLEIVLRNLLDNARKYTPTSSPLEIDARLDPAADHVQVRLRDYGAGIPPDQLDHIFERFSRGSRPPSGWTRGYGLGLYIARELLRAHNGEIWAENYTDGACFVLTLCTVAAGEASEPAPAEVPPARVPV